MGRMSHTGAEAFNVYRMFVLVALCTLNRTIPRIFIMTVTVVVIMRRMAMTVVNLRHVRTVPEVADKASLQSQNLTERNRQAGDCGQNLLGVRGHDTQPLRT